MVAETVELYKCLTSKSYTALDRLLYNERSWLPDVLKQNRVSENKVRDSRFTQHHHATSLSHCLLHCLPHFLLLEWMR